MKKRFLTALVVSALTSSAAFAGNTGEVRFIGAVTSATCNFTTEVNGVVKDTIDLGSMATNEKESKEVKFQLVPDGQECFAKTSGVVGWQSAGFTANGLANMNGTAKGVSIELVAVNSTNANTAITSNNQNAQFGNEQDGIGKFEFSTRMVQVESQAVEAGSVLAVASYAVAYK